MADDLPRALVGTRIQTIRKELRLSGAGLAKKAGVSQATVWAVEAGQNKPPVELLVGLAKLGVNLNNLLDDSDDALRLSPEDLFRSQPESGDVRPVSPIELQELADVIYRIPSLLDRVLELAELKDKWKLNERQMEYFRRLRGVYSRGDLAAIDAVESMLKALTLGNEQV